MKVNCFSRSETGPVRKQNEDTICVTPELGLFMVCDGMGGMGNGQIASENAAAAALEHISAHLPQLRACSDENAKDSAAEALLRSAVQAACAKLNSLIDQNSEYAGMGTTFTALLFFDKKAALGHVGDSRLYIKRRGRLHKLSRDHTIVQELLDAHHVSVEEAEKHPFSHVLTRAVGQQESVPVDTLVFDVLPNDLFLLCSDGFWAGYPEHDDLESSFGNWEELEDAKQLENNGNHLFSTALERFGQDNCSIIILSVADEDELEDDTAHHNNSVLLKIDTLREVPLFRGLSFQQILKIIDCTKVLDCEPGRMLITEGENCGKMFIVLDGEVSVHLHGQELNKLGRGSHFGEMALLSQRPRAASVEASLPSRLLVIEQEPFKLLVTRNPMLGVVLLWRLGAELSERLAQTAAQVVYTKS